MFLKINVLVENIVIVENNLWFKWISIFEWIVIFEWLLLSEWISDFHMNIDFRIIKWFQINSEFVRIVFYVLCFGKICVEKSDFQDLTSFGTIFYFELFFPFWTRCYFEVICFPFETNVWNCTWREKYMTCIVFSLNTWSWMVTQLWIVIIMYYWYVNENLEKYETS